MSTSKGYRKMLEDELNEFKGLVAGCKNRILNAKKVKKTFIKKIAELKKKIEHLQSKIDQYSDNEEVITYENHLTKANPDYSYNLVDAAVRRYEYSQHANKMLENSPIVKEYDALKTKRNVIELSLNTTESQLESSISDIAFWNETMAKYQAKADHTAGLLKKLNSIEKDDFFM